MKENPNITSDCGGFTGVKALDGLGRDIVVLTHEVESPARELFFDGIQFDCGYVCSTTRFATYVDREGLSDCQNGSP